MIPCYARFVPCVKIYTFANKHGSFSSAYKAIRITHRTYYCFKFWSHRWRYHIYAHHQNIHLTCIFHYTYLIKLIIIVRISVYHTVISFKCVISNDLCPHSMAQGQQMHCAKIYWKKNYDLLCSPYKSVMENPVTFLSKKLKKRTQYDALICENCKYFKLAWCQFFKMNFIAKI